MENRNLHKSEEKKTSISFEDLTNKISQVIPFIVDIYMSNSSDYFRKPMKGMWDEFITLNGQPDVAFYVGDAAGRPSDHSDVDRRFAHNICIPYYLPEEVFNDAFDVKNFIPVIHTTEELKHIPVIPKFPRAVDPLPKLRMYLNGTLTTCSNEQNTDLNGNTLLTSTTETTHLDTMQGKAVIIMTGRPASGKSHLTKLIASEYKDSVIISNDITGSSAKSKKAFKEALENSIPLIIVDNTSPSVASRDDYIDLLSDDSYYLISINAILSEEHCILLDEKRTYENKTATIPALVYRIYKSKYDPPSKKEGFDLLLNYIPEIPM